MKKKINILLGAVITILVSTACNLPGFAADQPTLDIIAVQQKQQTIIAEMTQRAPLEFTQTPSTTPKPGTLFTVTPSGSIPVTGITAQPQPIPTETLEPTISTSIPMVTVSVDTNCRFGPHIVYDYLGAVLVGEKTEIIGRHPTEDWLLVNNPDKAGQTCWITMQYAEISGNLNDVPMAPLPTFYDWNGTWTFVQFQIVVNGNLSLVQYGRNVNGVVNLSGGDKAAYSGTLSENGQIFSGTLSLDTPGNPTYPIYFKMLDNLNQIVGNGDNAGDFSVLDACGYRNSVGYLSGCPLP